MYCTLATWIMQRGKAILIVIYNIGVPIIICKVAYNGGHVIVYGDIRPQNSGLTIYSRQCSNPLSYVKLSYNLIHNSPHSWHPQDGWIFNNRLCSCCSWTRKDHSSILYSSHTCDNNYLQLNYNTRLCWWHAICVKSFFNTSLLSALPPLHPNTGAWAQ